MHACQAFITSYFDCALWKAMQHHIAFRDLHDLLVGVIGVTANEGCLASERELHRTLAQSQFGRLALRDVARQALDTQQLAGAIELGSCRLLQPDLPSVSTAKAEGQGIGRIGRAEFTHLGLESLEVIRVDAADEFLARSDQPILVIPKN